MFNQSFHEFISQNIQKTRQSRKNDIEDRNAFLAEYPLSRIKNLSIDEYCLGTEKYKDSLSYLVEFGKIGFGIGGGSARKHGVYFSKKDNAYMHGADTITDVDEFWPRFRDELYKFLTLSGESESALNLIDYPLLQGMAIVLTKYLSLYFPQKYMTIGSASVLKKLMDNLGCPYDDSMRCHQLNFILNDHIKKEYVELRDEDGAVLGNLAWEYINGESMKVHRNNETENEKGPGLGDEDVRTVHYWLYAPGPGASMWDQFSRDGIMGIGWHEIGDLSRFSSREEITAELQKDRPGHSCKNDSLALWQFLTQIQPGDIVYAKRGAHQILARGVVTSDYEYDPAYDAHYPNIRHVEWRQTEILERSVKSVQKTLTDITDITDSVRELEDWFADTEEEMDNELIRPADPPYSAEQFLSDVYMDRASYETLVGLVLKKKNVILQGAPGVGKTFAAKRLAYSMIGVKDQERIMMVQFHQSYSYEDFIEGFRPASGGNGFEIKKGAFYLFCRKAADDMEHKYFFIIDEINRGNLSKIFGELFMLIESDKRGNSLQLLYSDEKFFVPQNVYIIGMMNTADRSLAMLDYALRRRFAFFDMAPAFKSAGFREYRSRLANEKFNRLIECTERLNEEIARDESLGEGFCIGHSYFCNLSEVTDAALSEIVDYELAPLLKEYWYDDRSKSIDWINRLKDAIR